MKNRPGIPWDLLACTLALLPSQVGYLGILCDPPNHLDDQVPVHGNGMHGDKSVVSATTKEEMEVTTMVSETHIQMVTLKVEGHIHGRDPGEDDKMGQESTKSKNRELQTQYKKWKASGGKMEGWNQKSGYPHDASFLRLHRSNCSSNCF